jgi:hypothetical protein
MGADLASFLKKEDAEVIVSSFVSELLEADGSTKARRSASDNADIYLVGFALDGGGVEVLVCRGEEGRSTG